MSVARSLSAAKRASLNESPAGVGPLDDFVSLVVVPEDEQPVAELRLRGRDPRVELVGRREGVAVRQRSLQSQHDWGPRGVWGSALAGGDSLVAHRGVVGHGTELCAGIPGRHREHNAREHQSHSSSGPTAGRDNGGVQRPVPSTIPDSPGSYQFKDASGRMLYVGKAKSLRSRVMSYFSTGLSERTQQMVSTADSVEWIAVRNEVEALFLEFNLIKKHRPRFNIRLKDDKSYPYLAITLDEEWPRAMVMRGAKRKGVRYFGPYAHAYAIRETLDLLLRTFPIRTCTKNKFDRHARLGRPCLYAHIEKCVAPCVGSVTTDDYMPTSSRSSSTSSTATPRRFSIDSTSRCTNRATSSSSNAQPGSATRSSRCARRSSVSRWSTPRRRTTTPSGWSTTRSRPRCRSSWSARDVSSGARASSSTRWRTSVAPSSSAGSSSSSTATSKAPTSRARSWCPTIPTTPTCTRSSSACSGGARCACACPQRGAKRQLMETVTQNAHEAMARHKLKRASDHNARARALVALQDALHLQEAPLRIECYDISNLQGTEIVASMVVMEDGLPKRSDYRRFKIRHQPGQDDFASMEEVLTRRFRRYLQDRDEGARSGKRFAYPPNLVLIDGGKGQLGVAVRVLEEMGLEDIAVASLAKRFEEVYLPGDSEPVRIPRDSEALYLLQQVRDEAHRFAITYHRQLRDKKMTPLGARRRRPASAPSARRGSSRSTVRSSGSARWPKTNSWRSPGSPNRWRAPLYAHLHGEQSPA